jgi:hypothetical protein
MKRKIFISHVSEEVEVGKALKAALLRDFLGLVEVFVSSDTESIAAGDDWLRSIETALRECALVIILCSPASIHRPWINFEAGAAWMQGIPIIPTCHGGLAPEDLRMPLSLKQGIKLGDPEGLRRLYVRAAEAVPCDVPQRGFDALAKELAGKSAKILGSDRQRLNDDRGVRNRLNASLHNQKYRWRTLARVADEAAISQDEAADFLRSEPNVRFSRGKSGKTIVGLRSRVG